MFKRLLVTFLAFSLSACSGSHLDIFPELSNPDLMDNKLSVEQLNQDIDAFVQGVKLRHPEFEQYADEKAINDKVAQLKLAIDAPLTRTEFYQHVGQLSHLFNDGHSFLIWPYQEYNALKESGNKPFPFDVKASDQGLYIKHTYKTDNQQLSRGTKVLSINGRNVTDMLETMQQYVGGESRLFRDSVVAYRFALGLWSVFGDINDFDLTIEGNDGPRQLIISQQQDWQVVDDNQSNAQADYFFEVRETSNIKKQVGYLYVGSFDIDIDDFESFVDETFASIRQQSITSLIIDIRDNTGGNTDSGQYLARYLADKDFRLVSKLKERLNAENRGLFNYKGDIGDVIETPWTDWQSPMSESKRFNGDTYLLIGPISYSAAIVFATTLKDNQFATLIGRQTGGFANQTGQGNFFNLPHSELRAYVPTRLLLRPNGSEKVAGVMPDIATQFNQTDLVAGIDTDIQTAFAMIEKNQRD